MQKARDVHIAPFLIKYSYLGIAEGKSSLDGGKFFLGAAQKNLLGICLWDTSGILCSSTP